VYHIAVSFEVPAGRHEEFVAAALEDGRESAANEPGTLRFELIKDPENPNRFYLNEAYEDEAAFDAHAEGPYFRKFFDVVGDFVEGPTWLIKGTRIEDASLTVLASFRAKPGRRDEVLDALIAMIEPSLAEDGCLAYRPYADATDPDRVVLVERWVDRAALDFHFTTPHFKDVAAKLEELLAEPFTLDEFTTARSR
jgi:autoinducer 2-degrading protein